MTRDETRSAPTDGFLQDALTGLQASEKTLPAKYLWDERGSELFEAITRSAGYYATRTEMALLGACVAEVAALVGPQASVVEIGSGATNKVGLLLDALDDPQRYVGIDISAEFTEAAAARLRSLYPAVEVVFVEADYFDDLPSLPLDRSRPILGFLPGSTIGNMAPPQAEALLARLRRALGGFLLIGQDPCHDPRRLQAAYGSAEMARFHLNILDRLRDELGAEVEPDHFAHEARVLHDPRRVEAHLVATTATHMTVGGQTIVLGTGESIRTDLSWKYAPDAFADLGRSAGWAPVQNWRDPAGLFCLHLLRAP